MRRKLCDIGWLAALFPMDRGRVYEVIVEWIARQLTHGQATLGS